jgi:hypothetical protein
MPHRRLAVLAVLAAVAVCLSACVSDADTERQAESAALEELRALSAGFGDIAVAEAAGFSQRVTSCWFHRELGGQGYHYRHPERVDAMLNLREPELLMYEPTADGGMSFVAVEYVVPMSDWRDSTPPRLLGRQFMRNEQLQLWALHVWLGKENPSGLYADWNPTVSCAHAEESQDRAPAMASEQ